jgi:hypothetical protein
MADGLPESHPAGGAHAARENEIAGRWTSLRHPDGCRFRRALGNGYAAADRGADMSAAPAARTVPMDAKPIDPMAQLDRYLAGALPRKEAREFEIACQQNPIVIEQAGLADRVARAVTLLDATGRGADWHDKPRRPWEQPGVPLALAVATLVLAAASLMLWLRGSEAKTRIVQLQERVVARPVEAAASRRMIPVKLLSAGVPAQPAFVLGGQSAEMGEVRIDVSDAKQPTYRVTIERDGQGGVAVFHNLIKDSNGNLRFVLNSGALGPGRHDVTVEGVAWNGDSRLVGGTRFNVIRTR